MIDYFRNNRFTRFSMQRVVRGKVNTFIRISLHSSESHDSALAVGFGSCQYRVHVGKYLFSKTQCFTNLFQNLSY